MPYITGSRLKVERALKHLEELEREVSAFIAAHPYEYSRKASLENPNNVVYEFPPQPVPPLAFGVIVADFVHNLRSALDHVAWQLALLHSDKPYEKTAFPIFTRTDLGSLKHFARCVQSILPEAVPVIEAVQPYHSGNLAEGHPLWVLHCLWNADKHRFLPPIPLRFAMPMFSGVGGSVEHFENGALRVEVPKDSKPEVNLEPQLWREVLFEIPGPAGPMERVPLTYLRLIYDFVGCQVVPFFSRYLPESTDLVERKVRVEPRQG